MQARWYGHRNRLTLTYSACILPYMTTNIQQAWIDDMPWTPEGKGFIRPAELRIHLWPHAALTTVCEALHPDEFGEDLNEVGKAMWKLMRDKGIGLAANQVGITKRFFVMDMPDRHTEMVCNPVVVRSGEVMQGGVEGCLSLPGVTGTVLRPTSIKLQYQTPHGEERFRDLHDIFARCALHEIGHLDGKTFFSDSSRQVRRGIEREWSKKRPQAIATGQYIY